jgi:hypothetical protein
VVEGRIIIMSFALAVLAGMLGRMSCLIRFRAPSGARHTPARASPRWLRTQPGLAIKPVCLAKLMAYTQACDGEISGFGAVYVDADRRTFVLEDVSILRQRVTRASVEIEASDVADFLTDYVASGGDVNQLRCWWHSHFDMQAFHSSIDNDTLENALADAPWIVSLVVNRAGEMRASLVIHEPVSIWIDDIPISVYVEPELRASVQAEIARLVSRGWASYHTGTYGQSCPETSHDIAEVRPATGSDGRYSDIDHDQQGDQNYA